MVGFIYNHYDFQIGAISQGTSLPSRDNLGAFLVSSTDKVKTEEIKVLGRGNHCWPKCYSSSLPPPPAPPPARSKPKFNYTADGQA